MSSAVILFKQLLMMLIFMAAGRLLAQGKLINEDGSRALANTLLYLALPAAILRSYSILPKNPENIRIVLIALGGALLITAPAMLVAGLIFRKKNPVDNFAASYCNAGFVGVPLVTALLGPAMVAYMSGIIALQNALQWTYGQYLYSGSKDTIKFKEIAKSPLIIALVLGLVIFFCAIPIPALLESCIATLGSMTSPLAMLLMGVYSAKVSLKALFDDKHAYLCMSFRLLIIPLLTLPLLVIIPGSIPMKMVLFISCATPSASNTAVYAQRQNKDYGYAIKIICLCVIFCILTLPALIAVFDKVLPS
jgi:predicted permease